MRPAGFLWGCCGDLPKLEVVLPIEQCSGSQCYLTMNPKLQDSRNHALLARQLLASLNVSNASDGILASLVAKTDTGLPGTAIGADSEGKGDSDTV